MRYGYMRPAYVRLITLTAIALAMLAALVTAGVLTVKAIRDNERAAVLRESDALLQQSLAHSRALARERDSLLAVVATVDTVLITRIRRVRDTTWIPADTSPVVVLAACRAELDALATACESYRVAATAALAHADTLRRADSTTITALTRQLAARPDTVPPRSRWRSLAGAVVGTAALTLLLR
jgi:hypothetical protein